MESIQRWMVFFVGGLLFSQVVHADMCKDIRTIYVESQQHFSNWKTNDAKGEEFVSTVLLAGASSCLIDEDGIAYTCQWHFKNLEALSVAYTAMLDEVSSCPPLLKAHADIKKMEPQNYQATNFNQRMELVTYDYADADVVITMGKMASDIQAVSLAKNLLQFSFINAKHLPD
ncbi:hypothetical protein SAMN04515618_109171 [Collimonas sp. OK307]|uniref:hypothetical protein n=1 Tax=Collimonas sp. OK307 TaxID=1801620 RepID=UPI0008E41A47|nr:hypothetical protein [Collimonas sp. OK307]SFI08188.1 hypothetical protein SAMN04515618_109171 [Collimonas sp. OK307]